MEIIFGKKIKRILEAENITVTEFAKNIGMPYKRAYDFYKFNVNNPTLDSLQKIIAGYPQYTSYILGVDISELPKQQTP